ncbi:MAG: ATP-binding protein, partial [Sphingopyxis sp.]
GLGIAPEAQARIFEEFVQMHNEARDRRQGLGLGLAIARRLALLMNGDIAVRSALGQGSCMTVSLPRAEPPPEAAPAPAPSNPRGPVQPQDVPDIGTIPVGEATRIGVEGGNAVVTTEINGTRIDLRLPIDSGRPPETPPPDPPPPRQ